MTTLTVSRGGRFSPSLSFLSRLNTAEILENTPLNSVVLSLAWVAGNSAHRPVQFSIREDELPGREFSVSSRGELILRKTVDFETRESYEFSVTASDGWHNDTTRVRIRLININDWDPRFRHPEYAFYVSRENMVSGHKVGEVEVHDGDKGDHLRLDIMGAFSRVFRVTSRGELLIRDMNYMNGTDAHIVVTAEDSGIPPRRASVPVVVKFDANSSLAGGLRSGHSHNWVMIVILSIVIIFSLIVIVALGVYICKHKKLNKTRPSSSANKTYSENIQHNLHQIARPGQDVVDIRQSYRGHPRPSNNNNNGVVKNLNPLASARHDTQLPSNFRSTSVSSNSSSEINFDLQRRSSTPQTVYNPLNPRSGSRRYVKNAKNPRIHPPIVSQVSPSDTERPRSQGSQVSQSQSVAATHQHPNINQSEVRVPNINQSGLPKPPPPPKPSKLKQHPKFASTSDLSDAHASLQKELRRAILGSSQTSLASSAHAPRRLEWPRASLPRAVKKLSWPDTDNDISTDREISTYNYTDPNMSVTPATSSGPQLTLATDRSNTFQQEHF